MTTQDIKKVLIVGAGTMGLRIGLQAAMSGLEVMMYDINDEICQRAQQIQGKLLKSLIAKKMTNVTDEAAVHQRISWSTNLPTACQGVDFVSESVTEDLELKKKIWPLIGQHCPPHALLTTNTSYLLPSMMAKETGAPERFCAFHFHDVFWANVVDIMPHPTTAEWIMPVLHELGKKLNQTPVFVKRESSGYIFNSMLMAFIGAAGALVTYDVAGIYDVDRSWMGNFKMEMGPFGIIDNVGLDTAWHIVKVRKDEKSKKFAALLQSYIDEGKLGIKTGEGFYKYPNPAYKADDFVIS